MRANLRLKRMSLAASDVVVAVSRAIARDLRARAPELAATRIEIVPNPVDVADLRAQAAQGPRPMTGAYALYVGKLEPNKGVAKLLVAVGRARLDWPLVIVGDGAERGRLEAAARLSRRDVRFTGWLSRDQVLAWMRHAGLLIFPSHGPESLSRVLLEASALGASIAAMETGGTGDIVVDEETGLLSRSAEELGDDVARLRNDEALRSRLGRAAARRVAALFDAPVVLDRVEGLYRELVVRRGNASR
jgi:glycosyltransferase involved in cell wall biosynthesis